MLGRLRVLVEGGCTCVNGSKQYNAHDYLVYSIVPLKHFQKTPHWAVSYQQHLHHTTEWRHEVSKLAKQFSATSVIVLLTCASESKHSGFRLQAIRDRHGQHCLFF